MDALDKAIDERRAEVAKLRARLSAVTAELAGLELAAKLRPIASQVTNSSVTQPHQAGVEKKGAGRRAGDISHDWRAVLKALYVEKKNRSYEEIQGIAAQNGKPGLELSSVRDRIRNWLATGLVSGTVTEGFMVTEEAATRFGFIKENDPPEGGSLAEGETSVELSAREDVEDPLGLFS